MSSIPSWAVRGAKVVCVDARRTNILGIPELIEGGEYVIERVALEESMWQPLTATAYLVGVKRFGYSSADLLGFRLSRFRPLVPQKTEAEDTTYFRQFLTSKELA